VPEDHSPLPKADQSANHANSAASNSESSGIKAPRKIAIRPTRQPARSSSGQKSTGLTTRPPNEKQKQAQQAQTRKRPKVPRNRFQNPRFIFWAKVILIAFLVISIGLTVRAMMNIDSHLKGSSWSEELQNGNIGNAAKKLFTLTSDAVDQVLESDFSPEKLIIDFKAALPHLKKAGYILTELEVEVGLSPKLIPHFYHDPAIELDLDKTLAALEDNSIGTALMIALAQASKLQKTIEISDMQFNHIEVELGPIPSLKLQYKNDHAIRDYIHHE